MKRSRSGQSGASGSKRRNWVNSTVAMSAIPIGMPGWPDLACSTASIASARSAFAMRRNLGLTGGGSGGAAVVMAANLASIASSANAVRRSRSRLIAGLIAGAVHDRRWHGDHQVERNQPPEDDNDHALIGDQARNHRMAGIADPGLNAEHQLDHHR